MASNNWSTALIPPDSLGNTFLNVNNKSTSVVEEHLQPTTSLSSGFRLSVREQMLLQLQSKEKGDVLDSFSNAPRDEEHVAIKLGETSWGTQEPTHGVANGTLRQLPLKLQMLLQLQEREGLIPITGNVPLASGVDVVREGDTPLRYPKTETVELLKLRRRENLARQMHGEEMAPNSSLFTVAEPEASDGAQSLRSPSGTVNDTVKQPLLKADLRQDRVVDPPKGHASGACDIDSSFSQNADGLRNHWKPESRKPRGRSSASHAASAEDNSLRRPKHHGSYEVPPRFRRPPEVKSSAVPAKSQGEVFDSFASWRAAEFTNSPVAAPTAEKEKEEEIDIDALLLSPRDAGTAGTQSPGVLQNAKWVPVSPGTNITSPGPSGTLHKLPVTFKAGAGSSAGTSPGIPAHPGKDVTSPGPCGAFPKLPMTFKAGAGSSAGSSPGIPGYPGKNESQPSHLASPNRAAGAELVSPAFAGTMSATAESYPETPAVPYEVPGFPGTTGFRLANVASPPGKANSGSPLGSSGTLSRTSSISPGSTVALTGLPLLAGTHNTSPGTIRATSPMTRPFPGVVPGAAANTDLFTLQAVNALKLQQQDHAVRNLRKVQLQQLQREQVVILLLQQDAKQHKNADLVQMLTFLSQQSFKPTVPFINEQLLSILMNAVCVQRSVTPVEQYAAQHLAQLAASERLLFHT